LLLLDDAHRHRLRRSALHLSARRSRQGASLIQGQTLSYFTRKLASELTEWPPSCFIGREKKSNMEESLQLHIADCKLQI
jgi:hypothetical protein